MAHNKQLTYIDLFAGCGGLSLGLHWANWKGLFAIEKDTMAFETFFKNMIVPKASYQHFTDWPDWLPQTAHPIEVMLENPGYREQLAKFKEKVFLVTGGPPCQGFSVGGARREHDPRNQLAFKFLEFVSIVQPKFVMIENVEGILRPFKAGFNGSKKSPADCIKEELAKYGYSVGHIVASAVDCGVPQLRKRVIILGIRECPSEIDVSKLFGACFANAAGAQLKLLNLPLEHPVTVGEALEDLAGNNLVDCPDSPKYQTCKYLPPISVYAKLMRKNCLKEIIPNSHRFSCHGVKVLELYKKIHATQMPGRISKEFLLANGTKSDKKVLLDTSLPATTITTHPDEQIHFKYPRNISVREMARLQSFPDDFHFFGRYTLNGPRRKLDVSRNAQVGNAIPPLLGMALGNSIELLLKTLETGDARKYSKDVATQQLTLMN